ncbi:hypothetical protein COO60DRAFT_434032 [Scenedesmus sp. NREL 46B-D3]|nr:hypothetical protein COO60DRAFT_434032 [Scenedesmus sp. NREL 46B-D3]
MGTSRRSSGGMEEAKEGDSSASALCVSRVHYKHGLFGHVGQVCADAGNALVWVAADDGARVKAFRAPASLGGPRCKDAACNRSDNGMELQYTFCCDWEGENAGLHVAGTKVFAAMGSGALLTWDIAELAPQQDWKVSERALNWDDPMDEDDGSDIYVGDLDCRDTDGMDLDDLECSKGTAPHALLRLQRPAGADSCFAVRQTCLLAAAGAPDTLAAACSALYPHTNIVISYDLETQRAKRLLVGHLGEIMDISPAPASWHGAPHVFATASRSGDVKIWDVRSRGGAAAVTLGSASDRGMLAVALVAGSSSSSGSGSSRLGAGLCCFAGGLSQSVWAWDVRGGQGQALYELSTGNLDVSALAWHEPSSSLIASCDSSYEDRMGGCYREDFERVGGGSGGGDDEDEDDDESFDEDERWWPNKATHGAKDFPAYFAKSRSAVLCYTFSSSPSQQVPPSDEVYFAGGW